MTEPYVVPPESGRLLDLGTFQARVLADEAQTGGAFSLLQTQNEPPGFGPPMHIHHDAAEAFFVLEGEYRMFLPSGEQSCPPGCFVYVPRGLPHTFQVSSTTPGKKLNFFAPGAMIGFFAQLAEAEAHGVISPAMLNSIGKQHQMEVVGPVPDSYL